MKKSLVNRTRTAAVLMAFLHLLLLRTSAQQLVLPGDYPDPSVVKIGDTYWASATTSNWMPAYPLLKSKDLVNWQTTGAVFNVLPSWVDYYFWAPEITYDNGKVYIYYSAHKKDGNLCVGIASADRPEGPYKDHGPIICQPVGSIDAFPMRDKDGKLYMIWKEDANSVRKPTPIWIQELNEERTALVGEKKELFRNEAPWEANLVEGVSMIRHDDYFYAFYAAAGCCGAGCSYQSGIARAKSLLGPWEKYANNPILTNEGGWKCPGHGTPVEKDGKYYFLYHAYDTAGGVYTGRQGLLKEFAFTEDGWVRFIDEQRPPVQVPPVREDEFRGRNLSHHWQWNVFQDISARQEGSRLELNALPGAGGAFLGQKTYSLNYQVLAEVHRGKSDAGAGIALIGDEKNLIKAEIKGNNVQVVQVKGGNETVLATQPIGNGKKGHLRMIVRNGKDVSFAYSRSESDFAELNKEPINGTYLPPWDRALRVGVVATGAPGTKAVFDEFIVRELSD
ncbi:MAG TPA: family 43 glycosylhydrolase [Chitinophagaceae bacterium]